MDAGTVSLSSAILEIFRQQRFLAESTDKIRFGDFNSRLAAALYRECLKLVKVPKALADDAVSQVRERATRSARDINQTSSDWLDEGRDPRDVFSKDRARTIAEVEISYVKNAMLTLKARDRGKELEWVCDGSPCPDCRSLAGKRVKPGEDFVSKSGQRSKHPPHHVNCQCKARVV